MGLLIPRPYVSMGSVAPADQHARCATVLRPGLGTVPEAVVEALAGLAATPSCAIVQVCAPGDPLAGGRALAHAGQLIRESAPDCVVIGSTAHGVIGGRSSLEMQPGISVWLASLPGATPRAFRIATVPGPNGGLALTGLPDLRHDDRLAVLLIDPWTLPADETIAAFARVDGPLPVVGGFVSGGGRRGDSRVLLDGAVFDNGAVGLVLGADAPVRAVVSQGCRPIGDPMAVTAAQGNSIATLAGAPALDRVREVISALDSDEQALAVRGLHLGIAHDVRREGDAARDYVIRGILGVDAASGAIAVGDEVEVGAVVRLHLRDADSADADLRAVISAIGDAGASGAYLFTCNGRGSAMFTTPDHDAAVLREGLGTSQIGGFFAAGEIGPVGGVNHLHGFTAVVLVVDPVTATPDVEVSRADAAADSPELDLDAELRALLEP